MIDEKYLPKQGYIDLLPQSWEKSKRVAIGMGIARYCFNAHKKNNAFGLDGMDPAGWQFLLRCLGIHYYQAHKFLKFAYMHKPIAEIAVFMRDDGIVSTPPSSAFNEISVCMSKIGTRELHTGLITNSDIMIAMDAFRKWMSSPTGMEEAVEMFEVWGEIIEENDGATSFFFYFNNELISIDPGCDLTDGELTLERTMSTACDGCDSDKFCTEKQPNGQYLCKSCLMDMNGGSSSKFNACNHIECALHYCPSYRDTPIVQNLIKAPSAPSAPSAPKKSIGF